MNLSVEGGGGVEYSKCQILVSLVLSQNSRKKYTVLARYSSKPIPYVTLHAYF